MPPAAYLVGQRSLVGQAVGTTHAAAISPEECPRTTAGHILKSRSSSYRTICRAVV